MLVINQLLSAVKAQRSFQIPGSGIYYQQFRFAGEAPLPMLPATPEAKSRAKPAPDGEETGSGWIILTAI
jgi:hypothetical protein